LILLDIDVDTSSPNGEFMLNVMGSAAQWERRIISQRTKSRSAGSAGSSTSTTEPLPDSTPNIWKAFGDRLG
jgi:DNA invertase Pin-like site-specific DNA recombinase